MRLCACVISYDDQFFLFLLAGVAELNWKWGVSVMFVTIRLFVCFWRGFINHIQMRWFCVCCAVSSFSPAVQITETVSVWITWIVHICPYFVLFPF